MPKSKSKTAITSEPSTAAPTPSHSSRPSHSSQPPTDTDTDTTTRPRSLYAIVADHWGRRHPDRTALAWIVDSADSTEKASDTDELVDEVSYGELLERIKRAALALDGRKLQAGDRVGLIYSPGPDFLPVLLACLAKGLVAVIIDPVDPQDGDGLIEMAENIKFAKLKVILTDHLYPDFLEAWFLKTPPTDAKSKTAKRTLAEVEASGVEWVCIDAGVRLGPSAPGGYSPELAAVGVDLDSPAIMQLTGAKQATTFSHRSLLEGVMGFASMSEWHNRAELQRMRLMVDVETLASDNAQMQQQLASESVGDPVVQVDAAKVAILRRRVEMVEAAHPPMSFQGKTLDEAVRYFDVRHRAEPQGCCSVLVPLPLTFGDGLFFMLSGIYLGFKVYAVSPLRFHDVPVLVRRNEHTHTTLPQGLLPAPWSLSLRCVTYVEDWLKVRTGSITASVGSTLAFSDMRLINVVNDTDHTGVETPLFPMEQGGLWAGQTPPNIRSEDQLDDIHSFVKAMRCFVRSYGVPECFGFVTGKRQAGGPSHALPVLTIDKLALAKEGRIHVLREDIGVSAAESPSSSTGSPVAISEVTFTAGSESSSADGDSQVSVSDRQHTLVSCGFPMEGAGIKIVDQTTMREVQEGRHGPIFVHSRSLAMGYYRDEYHKTDVAFGQAIIDHSGCESAPIYLRTTDIGFMHGGQLFLLGSTRQLVDGGNGHIAYHCDIVRAVKDVDLRVPWSKDPVSAAGVCAVTLDESDNRHLGTSKDTPRIDCLHVAVIIKLRRKRGDADMTAECLQAIAFAVEKAIRKHVGIRIGMVELMTGALPADRTKANEMLLGFLADKKTREHRFLLVQNLRHRKTLQGIPIDCVHLCLMDYFDKWAVSGFKDIEQGRVPGAFKDRRDQQHSQAIIKLCAERLEREAGVPKHRLRTEWHRLKDELSYCIAYANYLLDTLGDSEDEKAALGLLAPLRTIVDKLIRLGYAPAQPFPLAATPRASGVTDPSDALASAFDRLAEDDQDTYISIDHDKKTGQPQAITLRFPLPHPLLERFFGVAQGAGELVHRFSPASIEKLHLAVYVRNTIATFLPFKVDMTNRLRDRSDRIQLGDGDQMVSLDTRAMIVVLVAWMKGEGQAAAET